MSVVILVLFSLARVSTLSVVVEKTFPPWFESTPAVKMPEAVCSSRFVEPLHVPGSYQH